MQPIASRRSPSLPPEPQREARAEATEPAPARSLVVIDAPARRTPGLSLGNRPDAPFLAQLIATAQQLPQTRTRRRAEPGEAAVRYAAAEPMRTGGMLRATI